MNILIKNTRLFDGKSDKLLDHASIIIQDNIVERITQSDITEENFDQVIDGHGLTAMPGMVDAHVHLGHLFDQDYHAASEVDYGVAISTAVAEKILMAGFTTVRDAGGVVQGLKKAIDQGYIKGPRIFPSNSVISQTCGHGDSIGHENRDIQYRVPLFSVLADGASEVRRAVREQFYKGAAQIKIMAGGGCSSVHDPLLTVQLSFEEMKAAVDCAADYGTYVMAHLYTSESIMRAGKAGVLSFEHGQMMDEEAAKMIAANGLFITPCPQFSQPVPGAFYEKAMLVAYKEQEATELINKNNLNILFGTDLMLLRHQFESPDFQVPESKDLKCYQERFGSFHGLLAATGNCNELFKHCTYQNPYSKGKLGVLTEGSYADILLVNGNPIEDLSVLADTSNIRMIMKDAVLYKDTLSQGGNRHEYCES
ncbi:MAG: amidohydrolase family protein [Lachnospiraceae bacterium]|jgi:imidazolonepropionase-like amidohydrolase|nr:amidohydrolase family protein [Lachnospiraceae bacterium]MCH4032010.1 amidohydrolase family protein [Lachnospiraceae bacterium]MCH4070628.1 amidohydrolase family protein [Lachnospiraceae bacterium]MCH4109301.1 amidohydrolase family protein [Lachnospiraceae bacterium]